MIERRVIYGPEARDDLFALYDRTADAASPMVAFRYTQRVEAFVAGLGLASERGTRRDDIRQGLRIVGFERRVTVAFAVTDVVTILRIFPRGRDWSAEF